MAGGHQVVSLTKEDTHTVDGCEIQFAPRNETMVKTITFVGIYRGIEPFQSVLGGAGFCPSTVLPTPKGVEALWFDVATPPCGPL